MRLMVITPVAVEKLARQEFAETTLRQEALQAIFPPRLNIFYHPNLGFLQEKRVFQQPPLFSTLILLYLDREATVTPAPSSNLEPITTAPDL
jgi:hypothetical protein